MSTKWLTLSFLLAIGLVKILRIKFIENFCFQRKIGPTGPGLHLGMWWVTSEVSVLIMMIFIDELVIDSIIIIIEQQPITR